MRLLTELGESLRIAGAEIRANKSRGFLTTLGIVIGIVGVVTTMTAANGLSNSFQESIAQLGSDVLYVSRTPWIVMGNFARFRDRPHVTLKDSERLDGRLHRARAINPTAGTQRHVKYRSTVLENVNVIGTTDHQVLVSTAVPELGRFLTGFDVHNKKLICVIGRTVRERLFESTSPINKKIRIGRSVFRVVGVMEKQGSASFFGGPDFDSQVFVPITSFMKAFGGRDRNLDIAVKALPGADLEEFEYEVIGEMRKIRRLTPNEDDDFSINTMSSLRAAYDNVMGVVVAIGLVITSISLFVGGIGVANIMFVSVTERTREIGVRKAIGATKRAILAQFLFESSAVCLAGGTLGLLLAYGATTLIDRMTPMPASISPFIVVVALATAIAVGVVAGFVPAYRASRLDPIEALRYE